ncbi:efflux RND transporter periplasmic adaptor subunit [Pseudomonas sp. GX19020]|uniref:efflux RND transporter periplasmic adaptor subunit n=1 Tax=Pseudomonas sp. GX19020 TaxID=2942277 RepID=UPI0020194925|nr:efflux RND transporter periplasmic adaptor subunit [Pseudomonas sp. GX19020]MCL4067564.1 efflux RND transporter periplasmic adaptor subunit [Pseudomonas sp. GX19020]
MRTQLRSTGTRPQRFSPALHILAAMLVLLPAGLLTPLPLLRPAMAQETPSPPPKAGYVVLERASVPVQQLLTGRAVARSATQLRPRVGGEITAILYTPGAQVEAGTPLFTIDPLTYRAALASAEASLARASADLKAAETSYGRVSALRGSSASQAALDIAETDLLKAQAGLAEAESGVDLARAQLDWTTIRAPITGIVGVAQVSVGDLVTQGQAQALAEIVQVDPVLVDLSEPYQTRLAIEARAERGEIELITPELVLVLDGGRRIAGQAALVSSAATVSSSTGTRTLRFEVLNPGGMIAPGMFVQAELTLARQQAILVPQRATQRERDGRLSAWIAVDGKVTKRYLTETGTWEAAWIVQAGLEPGDWLLLDGINTMREGREITPVPVTIDAQGVVRDLAPATAGGAGN